MNFGWSPHGLDFVIFGPLCQTVNTVAPTKGFENGKTENLNSYDLESVSSQLVFMFSIIFALKCNHFIN